MKPGKETSKRGIATEFKPASQEIIDKCGLIVKQANEVWKAGCEHIEEMLAELRKRDSGNILIVVPDNPRHIAKEYNIKDVQNGDRVEIKPGDKAWVFDDFNIPAIREVTILSVTRKKGQRPKYSFGFSDNERDLGVYWSYNVFPSREALCEHYRKIFE